MDESSNDMEPNFKPKYHPKPTAKGYVVYQTTLPVLPIHYVNQQNARYAQPTTTSSSNGGGHRPRAPSHRIVFPTSSNYATHTYQFQPPTGGSLLLPPVPTQSNLQQTASVSPAVSAYGTPQPAYLNQGNGGARNFLLSSSQKSESQRPTGGAYDPRSFLSQATSDPYNLPPPPPPPPPPQAAASWKPMFPSSTSTSSANPYDLPGQDEFTTQQKEPSGRYKRQATAAEEEEVESVCRTQMQFISPKVALNDKAEWKFIVNLAERDPRLKQVIKVDVCS